MKLLEESVLHDLEDTKRFAATILPLIGWGKTVALSGVLGSGKTTFVSQLAGLLGARDVSSPTFVLQHEYQTDAGKILEHWDLYRLAAPPFELFEPPPAKTLRLVEWADKFPEITASCDFLIKIDFQNIINQVRRIELYSF